MKKKLFVLLTLSLSFLNPSKAQWQQTPGPGDLVHCFINNGGNLFAGTDSSGVFRSTDNGISWTAVNGGLTDSSILSLTKIGSNIFAGTNFAGVFRSSDNGVSWVAANTGLTTSQIYCLTASGTDIYAGTDAGLFLSNNNGTSWIDLNIPAISNILSIAISGGTIYAGTAANGIYISTDNGSSWTSSNTGINPLHFCINAIAISGSNLFSGANNWGGVYLSTDNGSNWTPVNIGFGTGSWVQSFTLIGNKLFAGTTEGVYLFTNNGTQWTRVNQGLGSDLQIWGLGASTTSLFAGSAGGFVYKASQNDTIKGTVSVKAGPVNGGYAKLYRNDTSIHMAKADSVQIDALGNYSFNNVFAGGGYLVYANATANYPLTIPTYADSTVLWDSAKVITTGSGNVTANILLKEFNSPAGSGIISGKIVQGEKYIRVQGVGDPLSKIDIKLGKQPKSSNHFISCTTTDINGVFTFNNLPQGDYYIYVDITGLPMESTYDISVTATETVFNNLNYTADSTKIQTTGSVINITGISNNTNSKSINIYPNPTSNQFIVETNSTQNKLIQIFDMRGTLMFSQTISTKSIIDANDLAEGIYTIIIKSGEEVLTKKLVIVK